MLLDPYEFQPVTIRRIVREAQKAVSVQLNMPAGYTYLAGQHAVVRVTVGETKLMRQYSFSSAPSSDELWLTVVETPRGAVSTWFNQNAKVGDALEISRPFMGPLVQVLPRGQICMIAGGSGVAPLMSLLREERINGEERPIRFMYSTRSAERCFTTELSPTNHGGSAIVQLSDISGRFDEATIHDAVKDCSSIFICGSRDFVSDMRKICAVSAPGVTVYNEAFTLE